MFNRSKVAGIFKNDLARIIFGFGLIVAFLYYLPQDVYAEQEYTLGESVNTVTSSDGEGLWYRMVLDKTYVLDCTHSKDIFIFDSNKENRVWSIWGNSNECGCLLKGTYYIKVFNVNSSVTAGTEYSFCISAIDEENNYQSFIENYEDDDTRNNEKEQATEIPGEGIYHGIIGYNNYDDWYKLTVEEDTYIQFSQKDFQDMRCKLTLFDSDNKVLLAPNASDGRENFVESIIVSPGTYYINAARYSGTNNSDVNMSYKIVVGSSAKDSEEYIPYEPTGYEEYSLGETKGDNVTSEGLSKWYILHLERTSILKCSLMKNDANPTMFIFDMSGRCIYRLNNIYSRSEEIGHVGLLKGTYLVLLSAGGNSSSTGEASFRIDALEPEKYRQSYEEIYDKTSSRNDSIPDATKVDVTDETVINGILGINNPVDCYRISIPVKTQMEYWEKEFHTGYLSGCGVRDESGKELFTLSGENGKRTLDAGVYYVVVCRYNFHNNKTGVHSYRITFSDDSSSMEEYKISYDSNGAVIGRVPGDSTGFVNDELMLPAQGEMEFFGREFLGWDEDAEALDAYYAPGQKIKVPGSMKLYAIWKKPLWANTLELNKYIEMDKSITPTPAYYEFTLEEDTMVSVSVEMYGKPASSQNRIRLFEVKSKMVKGEYEGEIPEGHKTLFRRMKLAKGKYYIALEHTDGNGYGFGGTDYGIYVNSYRDGLDLTEHAVPVINNEQFLVLDVDDKGKYYFPKKAFDNIYKSNAAYKALKKRKFKGDCWGFTAAAILNYRNLLNVDERYFSGPYHGVNAKGYDDLKGELLVDKTGEIMGDIPRFTDMNGLGMTINEFQIFQYSNEFHNWSNENMVKSDFRGIISHMYDDNAPLLVRVRTYDKCHIISTDSCRPPLSLGNFWYRIFVYDCNSPYYKLYSNSGIDEPLLRKLYNKSENRYIDVNIYSGSWAFYGGENASDSESVYGEIKDDDKSRFLPEKVCDAEISFFTLGDELNYYLGKKLSYGMFEDSEAVHCSSGSLSVKRNDGTPIYREENGTVTYVDGKSAEIVDIAADSVLGEGGTDKRVFISENRCEHIIENGKSDIASGEEIIILNTEGIVTVRQNSPESFTLSSDKETQVDLCLVNETQDGISSTSAETSLKVYDRPLTISLRNGVLTIESPVSQDISITLENKDGNYVIEKIATDDVEKLKFEDYIGNKKKSDENILNKALSKTFEVDGNKYTVNWNAAVQYDGRKHYGVGTDDSGMAAVSNDSPARVYDLKVRVTKNGEILPPATFSVKTKNNKNACLSSDGITTLQKNTKKFPIFKLIFKGKEYKKLNRALKNEVFEFGIIPLELKQDGVTFDKVKLSKDGSITVKELTMKLPSTSDGTVLKPVKLKYRKQEGKTDFVVTTNKDGSLTINGRNNYCGTVVYMK